jgi:hypothetical protein
VETDGPPRNGCDGAANVTHGHLYAAGSIYSNSILDSLVCQAHFNPAILEVLASFLGRGLGAEGRKPILEQSKSRDAAASHHQLMLLDVPEDYVGHMYHELLSGLAQQSCIAIGLYRMPGTSGSPLGYVTTNPLPDTLLCEGDRMYVITGEVEIV